MRCLVYYGISIISALGVVTEHMLSVHWIRVQYGGGGGVQVGGSGGSIGASTLPRNNSLHSGLVNLNSLGREESVT